MVYQKPSKPTLVGCLYYGLLVHSLEEVGLTWLQEGVRMHKTIGAGFVHSTGSHEGPYKTGSYKGHENT